MNDLDPLYQQACTVVLSTGNARLSNLQRMLVINYNRASRLLERMEENGLVSPPDNTGNRTVLTSANPEKHFFHQKAWHPIILDPMGDYSVEFCEAWIEDQKTEREQLIATGEPVA